MVQEGQGSGQPRQDQCPQSLALNVTSDSSFDHGNNNKSADAAPTDQPKSRYKCKFLHLVNIKIWFINPNWQNASNQVLFLCRP